MSSTPTSRVAFETGKGGATTLVVGGLTKALQPRKLAAMLKSTILESILNLLILAPLFFLARRSNKERFYFSAVLYFVVIYLVSNVLTYSLSSVVLFPGQRFNWVGKGAATLFLLLCAVYLLRAFGREQFGLTGGIQWEGTRPILIVCTLYLLLRIGLYSFSGEASAAIHPETALFQATLPGIHEELLYRGLLLGLLGALFVRPSWRFANVDFGWPAIITSLLFGLFQPRRQLLRACEVGVRRIFVCASGAQDQEHSSCCHLP
jgi:hypothetical protein